MEIINKKKEYWDKIEKMDIRELVAEKNRLIDNLFEIKICMEGETDNDISVHKFLKDIKEKITKKSEEFNDIFESGIKILIKNFKHLH